MPQRRPPGRDKEDPGQPLRKESEKERREEEGGPADEAQRQRGSRSDGHEPQESGKTDPLRGRPPGHEPDVFVDVPKAHVDEIYLDVEGLDAHLSLRAKLANLVQLVAGVHVHCAKVELDIKGVDAEALLKVRLENLYDILDRALSTIDRNPQILDALLKTMDTAVEDLGQTAHAALGPQGAVTRTVDQVGQTAQTALRPGGAGDQALDKVGEAAEQAVGPGGAVTQTGQEVGAAVDDTGAAVGGVATDVGADTGPVTDEVDQATGDVAEQGSRATGQTGQGGGDTGGTAPGAGENAGQRRVPASRRAREGQTKRGSKRGMRRSRSSDDDGSERGRVVRSAAKVGKVAQQALGHLPGRGASQAREDATEQVGQAAGAAVQQVGHAAGAAVEQVAQAAAKATEQIGEAAVEASGKASWTPTKAPKAAKGTAQRRATGRRRSDNGQPKPGERQADRGAKRGTRSKSSGRAGK